MTEERKNEILREVMYYNLADVPVMANSLEAFCMGQMVGRMERQLEIELEKEVEEEDDEEKKPSVPKALWAEV